MFPQKSKVLLGITKSNWGGAQKYVFDLATSLPKDDFDITVVFGGNGLMQEKLERAGVKIERLNLENKIGLLKNVAEFFAILKIIYKNNPDILHLNSSKMGIMAALASRICNMIPRHNTKIIFTAHGWAFNEDRPIWQRSLIKIIHWKTVFMSHMTICVSSSVKKQIESLPLIRNRLVLINNGISDIQFIDKSSAREKIFEKIGAGNKDMLNNRWIGTISELHKNKGLKYAIEAFSKIEKNLAENISFIIIGEGDERGRLDKLISELNLSGKVFLVGKIDEAGKYLKAFDIFTLTSITEALGYVILEAGKAELPVVASAVGGIPEIIENNINGILVKVENIEEISRAIEILIKNKDLREKYGKALKNKVNLKFSIPRMIQETVQVYNK
ncbi:MAG: glycosyltransferase [Candidatus Paceibacterota bacterium]|jgi:glycosyltransferase involved in cell wall biosynthesis